MRTADVDHLSMWRETRLGDLARIRRGASPQPIDNPRWFAESGPGWVRISDVTRSSGRLRTTEQYLSQDGVDRSVRVGRGDVIMSICATIGEPVIVEMDACIHDGFVVFDQFENSLDRQFLLHLLRKIAPEFKASGQTGTQANLNTGIVNGKVVTVPSDTLEQSRIAAVLDTVDEAIATTEAVIAKLRQVRAGLLHDLLTRGLDEHGQLRDHIAHPEQFKDSPLGRIPREWEVVRVGSEAEIAHGFAFDGRLFTDKPIGPRLLVPGNFHRDGGLYFTDENTKYFAGEFPPETVLANGDILIVMTDLSPMTLILGRTVLLNEPFPVLHNQRIGKFRFKQPADWNPAFFVALMNDERLRRKVIREATGTTVRHTSPDRIKSGLGAKPRRKEQDQIVSTVQTFDSEIAVTGNELAKLSALKSGLMTDLLTGRVRAPELEDGRRCG